MYTRQSKPLGLGHAIWCARDIVGDEPFAVLLADDLIQTDKPVLSEMVKKFDLTHLGQGFYILKIINDDSTNPTDFALKFIIE